MDRMEKKNLTIKLEKSNPHYTLDIIDVDGNSVYSISSTDFSDMFVASWNFIDVYGDKEKEEEYFQEFINNEC